MNEEKQHKSKLIFYQLSYQRHAEFDFLYDGWKGQNEIPFKISEFDFLYDGWKGQNEKFLKDI